MRKDRNKFMKTKTYGINEMFNCLFCFLFFIYCAHSWNHLLSAYFLLFPPHGVIDFLTLITIWAQHRCIYMFYMGLIRTRTVQWPVMWSLWLFTGHYSLPEPLSLIREEVQATEETRPISCWHIMFILICLSCSVSYSLCSFSAIVFPVLPKYN